MIQIHGIIVVHYSTSLVFQSNLCVWPLGLQFPFLFVWLFLHLVLITLLMLPSNDVLHWPVLTVVCCSTSSRIICVSLFFFKSKFTTFDQWYLKNPLPPFLLVLLEWHVTRLLSQIFSISISSKNKHYNVKFC